MKLSVFCFTLAITILCSTCIAARRSRKINRNLKRFDTAGWPFEVSSFYGFESKFPRSYIPNPLTKRVKKTIRDPTAFRTNYSPYFVPKSQRVRPWGSKEYGMPWRRNGKYGQYERFWRPERQTEFSKVEARQAPTAQSGWWYGWFNTISWGQTNIILWWHHYR